MLEAAIQAKKHIYCEKPIGVDVEGCKRAIKAAKQADKSKTISVGFQQRSAPCTWKPTSAFRTATSANWPTRAPPGSRTTLSLASPTPTPPSRRSGTGSATGSSPATSSSSRTATTSTSCTGSWAGLPLRAIGNGNRKIRKDFEILDNIHVVYEWPNGFIVTFEANQLTPRGFSRVGEEFTGTKGTIHVSRAA